jgi:hypothetical protein
MPSTQGFSHAQDVCRKPGREFLEQLQKLKGVESLSAIKGATKLSFGRLPPLGKAK